MNSSTSPSQHDAEIIKDLEGIAFYKPEVVAIYCLINLPLGFCLYGLNSARRESSTLAVILSSLSIAYLLMRFVANAIGMDAPNLAHISFFIGLGFFKREAIPYRRAILRGGKTARWWPPLLIAVASQLSIYVLISMLAP